MLNEVSRLKRFKNMNKCSIESKYDGDQNCRIIIAHYTLSDNINDL